MKLAIAAAVIYLAAVGALISILASITSGSAGIGLAWGIGAFIFGAGAAGFCYWRIKRELGGFDFFY